MTTPTAVRPAVPSIVDVDAPKGTDLPELHLEDCAVVVCSYPGVVVAGVGATVWARPGVVVDAQPASVVHLAPGAQLLEERPGALERGDITVLTWDPSSS